MEAPPLSTTPPIPSTTPQKPAAYTDSGHADPPPPKLRLMCSYGGHIVPRPHDKALSYVGGDTRIVVVDRDATLSDLHRRLSRSLLRDQPFSLKYQLPSEELDSLISVSTDEDLENMVEEYDRLNSASAADVSKPCRLRLFLFPKSQSSVERILAETASAKSEEWFFSALNGKSGAHSAAASDRGFSDSSSVNCLLGLDDDLMGKAAVVESGGGAGFEDLKAGVNGNENPNSNNHVINQDVQSVPNSPMLGTSSSFGSTSSSPSVANLPPIKVHADDNPKVGGTGIEEQFQQMSVGVVNLPPPLKQEEAGIYTTAGVAAGTVVQGIPVAVGGEYANRVIAEDEGSDHGGYGKVQQIQPQVQDQLQPHQILQFQQKQTRTFDLPSPDSVSSEASVTNSLPRQRQAIIYQEPFTQIQATNTKISTNQLENKTLDQNNTQSKTQPLAQEQVYVLPGNVVPISSYYPIYPPQLQNQHHYHPVYFVPNQMPYNQSRSVPSSTGPKLVNSGSEQFVGLSPIYQPPSGQNTAYGYEFANQKNVPVYYKPLLPQMAAQYQKLVVPDASREAQP
ncbi:octicosapeptide/Phox/Bem1p family protein [Striga asiatica]|uniref:Octicosapeptide/Phox/Bem1p family protein n=1 Tax=Striga asiatica TaxID=4170 RepID=A0A5A7PAL3_STRAF|nr:octicosapeptide/Phox/Bem1p family protein [Striga asiatica]